MVTGRRSGDLIVEAVATPGHSIGHLSYVVRDGSRSDLFTGDTLLFGGRIILQNTWDYARAHLRSHCAANREYRFDGLFPEVISHLHHRRNGERRPKAALSDAKRGGIPPCSSN